MTEKQIEKMMKSLGLTRDEAIEMLMEDEAVDKMSMKEVTSDLSEEQKKAVKAVTKTTSDKPKAKTKRERKVDEVKKGLLLLIADVFKSELGIDSTLENEVALHFNYEGADYDLKLIKHRPPKVSK